MPRLAKNGQRNLRFTRRILLRLAFCLCALSGLYGLPPTAYIHSVLLADEAVPRLGVFEQTLRHTGQYDNPYVQVTAACELTEPDGVTKHSVPLFWDGDARWMLRFAPPTPGQWRWRVTSSDAGLAGKTGTFRVSESDLRGSIQPMKGYPSHFQRQDGTPFWFMGDTAWALYTDDTHEQHDAQAARRYLKTRAAQGFNVVHSMLLSEAGWGNRGGPPFDEITRQKINPGYWQEVDRRLRLVNQNGLIAGLALAWGDKRKVEPYAWRRFPSLEARKRYARYIAARYGAFDVYFIVSGEWHAEVHTREDASEEAMKAEFIEIGDALREADPHDRMMAIHPMTSHGSTREFVATGWMSFGDYQQNYDELHDRMLQSRQCDLPVVNAEYAYFLRDQNGDGMVDKPNSCDDAAIRHASWDIAMAGSYFVSGFGTTYFGGNRHPGPFDVDAESNDIWENQIQHIPRLFTSLEWWKLRPDDQAITCQLPRENDGTRTQRRSGRKASVTVPPPRTYWLLADPGKTYVAYVRGSSAPVHIAVESGTYRVGQFNPRRGQLETLGPIDVQKAYQYRPPDEQDWVVTLRSGE